MSEHDLAFLITDVKGSLEREIHGLAREMRDGFAELNARFDVQGARLDEIDGPSNQWPLR
jgi:hypothetical protein